MSWDPKCLSSGTPNDILFYFSCPLFYWCILDTQYYTSYRYSTKWVTVFKGYTPFLIKYQLCSLYCTISPWNLFMLDYFSFNRLHWAHMVSQTTCWPPHEPKSTQPSNSKDGPHTPGRGCKERIQPPGKTGPESSFHTERLMSYPFAVSFKGISIPQLSARETGVIVFLAFSAECCAEFRSWNPVNINCSSNYFYETSCSSPVNGDWGGRGWCLSHSYSFLAGAVSGSVTPGLEKHLMELQPPSPHQPS